MSQVTSDTSPLSPWWKQAVLLVMIFGFSLLALVTVKTYQGAPPIPARVVEPSGQTLFTGDDIKGGQDVFFKYGLMEHGTFWGHGAYLGPDYTAEYLHRLAEIGRDALAQTRYGKNFQSLSEGQALEVGEALKGILKQNRYDKGADVLTFTGAEAASYRIQAGEWKNYFAGAKTRAGPALQLHPRRGRAEAPECLLRLGHMGDRGAASGCQLFLYEQLALRTPGGQRPHSIHLSLERPQSRDAAGGVGTDPLRVREVRLFGLGWHCGLETGHAEPSPEMGSHAEPEGGRPLLRRRRCPLPCPGRSGRRAGPLPC